MREGLEKGVGIGWEVGSTLLKCGFDGYVLVYCEPTYCWVITQWSDQGGGRRGVGGVIKLGEGAFKNGVILVDKKLVGGRGSYKLW